MAAPVNTALRHTGSPTVAAGISSEQFVGEMDYAYKLGLPVANWEWLVLPRLSALLWIFVPLYVRNNIATMPEYLERRFGGSARTPYACLTIASYGRMSRPASVDGWQAYPQKQRARILVAQSFLAAETEPAGAEYDPSFFGGIDELLPNDIAETINGVSGPDHGELWTMRLDWQIEWDRMEAVHALAERRKIVVAGASSGIGRAAAIRFASDGCEVCVNARREGRLRELITGIAPGLPATSFGVVESGFRPADACAERAA